MTCAGLTENRVVCVTGASTTKVTQVFGLTACSTVK